MPLGTNNVTLTTAGGGSTSAPRGDFIPQLWSDEVIAAYKANLVVANQVTKLNHRGKKGDTITIPIPTRGAASAKAAGNQVTLIAANESSLNIYIDKHYEYSRFIEDIVEVQALSSLRKFYTDDAGYALARQVDFDIHVLGTALQGGTLDTSPGTIASPTLTYTAAVIGGDGSTTYSAGNATALSDAGIRQMFQTLDDADVPLDGRSITIPPVEKKNLLGIARYTEEAFVGDGSAIRTGMIGNVYGVPIFVSTTCPSVNSGAERIGMLLHKDALVFAEQMSVRSQTQYKQEWLADLYTSDTIYGTGVLRNDAGIAFAVPA